MKILIVLQRQFAYTGHALAVALKKRLPESAFCAYVNLRESYDFLRSQNDIAYTGFIFNEEVHNRYKREPLDQSFLAQLKKDCGLPNLWPYLEIDRITRFNQFLREYPYDTPKYTHEEMLRILQVKAKALTEFLEREKPDAVISSVVIDTITMLLHTMAKKRGIPFLLIQEGRVDNRHTVTEDYCALDEVERAFEDIRNRKQSYPRERTEALAFIERFRKNPKHFAAVDEPEMRPTSRGRQFQFLRPARLAVSIMWFLKLTVRYLRNPHADDPHCIRPWHYALDHIKRKLRVLRGFDDLYDEPMPNEDYAFFPLQLEPEISLSLLAPFYVDQLWVIKQIARSLPVHHKLYVKEHPAMFGCRTRRYYRELRKIPNVKLIRPTVRSYPLIQNAKLVLTISSTVGWEASLFKKPVITFGGIFYNALSGVIRCSAIEELPYLIEKQIMEFRHDEEELINLVTAIYAESVDFPLVELWEIDGASNMEKKFRYAEALAAYIANKLTERIREQKR